MVSANGMESPGTTEDERGIASDVEADAGHNLRNGLDDRKADNTLKSAAEQKVVPLGIEDGPGVDETPQREYMTGWRLYVLAFSLSLCLYLSTLEKTIVSTSLVSISSTLGGFDQRDWVVTSYLLTLTGFLVIYAKFSDILERKYMLLLAVGMFTFFSIVCGTIHTILQLIIFRAFQGMGASGIYAMVTVMNPEMVSSSQWGKYVGITSIVFVLNSILGPVLGRCYQCTQRQLLARGLPTERTSRSGSYDFDSVHPASSLSAPDIITSDTGQIYSSAPTSRQVHASLFRTAGHHRCITLLFGASIQVLGVGLASSAGISGDKAMYGFEAVMGLSFGTTLIIVLVYIPFVLDRSDLAVGMSSITQIRVLGGTLGLAASATVLSHFISPRLPSALTPDELEQLSDLVLFIKTLPDVKRDAVRLRYNDAFNEQLRVMLYFSVAIWLSCLLLWERNLKTAKDITGY